MKRLSLFVLISTLSIGCNEFKPISNNIEDNISSEDIDLENGKSDRAAPCQEFFKQIVLDNRVIVIKEPNLCNPHAKIYDHDDITKRFVEVINPNIEQQKVIHFYDNEFFETCSYSSSEI